MTKATKKDLRAALAPLRKAAERYALGLTTGGKPAPRHEPIVWRGLKIDVEVVRRAQVVCGVPFPYAVFELWYYAYPEGQYKIGGGNGAYLIDVLFQWQAQGKITL